MALEAADRVARLRVKDLHQARLAAGHEETSVSAIIRAVGKVFEPSNATRGAAAAKGIERDPRGTCNRKVVRRRGRKRNRRHRRKLFRDHRMLRAFMYIYI